MHRSLLVGSLVATAVLVPATVLVDAGPGGRTASASELPAFDDCADALSWFKKQARDHDIPYGHGSPEYALGGVVDAAASTARSASALDATGSHGSGTNVQEAGVDEADLVKTDGRYVYTVRGRVLSVVDTAGRTPRRVDRLTLDHEGQELLLDRKRVLVVGGSHTGVADDAAFRSRPAWGGRSTRTDVTTVDVSDPAQVRMVGVQEVDGHYLSARLHDGVVRLVMAYEPSLPVEPPRTRVADAPPGTDAWEAAWVAAHRRAVQRSTIDDWLPQTARRDATGRKIAGGRFVECRDLRRPTEFSGLSTVSVLALDLRGGDAAGTTTGLVAGGETVYAAEKTLYVASTRSPSRAARVGAAETKVHAFSLDGATTSYQATGTVAGAVPGRWALSEHQGLLRVASTLGTSWGGGNGTETVVNVLRRDGEKLVRVGWVGGLGRGEGVKAVRWFGDLGVVVTFRTTDPLYTVDLADPTRPRVAGELKIPGYSGYLHPVGRGMLLGVGRDADERTGASKGAQVSLFDLTDIDEPRRVDLASLGKGEALAEHESRAFTHLPDRATALLPMYGERGSRIAAVRVDTAAGRLSVSSLAGTPQQTERATPVGEAVAAVGMRELRLVDPADGLRSLGVVAID